MDRSKKKRTRKGSHSYSILQGKEKYCYVTGRTEGLDKHHIYHGPGWRDISDKHGFWVYLWQPLHLANLGGLHKYPGTGLDLKLKQDCQRRFEETHSREEFMAIIGKNYLDEEYPQMKAPAEQGTRSGFAKQNADNADNDGFYLLEGGEE